MHRHDDFHQQPQIAKVVSNVTTNDNSRLFVPKGRPVNGFARRLWPSMLELPKSSLSNEPYDARRNTGYLQLRVGVKKTEDSNVHDEHDPCVSFIDRVLEKIEVLEKIDFDCVLDEGDCQDVEDADGATAAARKDIPNGYGAIPFGVTRGDKRRTELLLDDASRFYDAMQKTLEDLIDLERDDLYISSGDEESVSDEGPYDNSFFDRW